ncbi:MAG: leucine-rich repeat domain-containing protein [Muribaculaceae bacterium]|nr:leucine-rich repeat domain-containing protein [Muribaculaceae bacterium]
MKRIVTTRFGMLVAMLLTILPISAYDFEVDGIYYEVISFTDLTCKVVRGNNEYEGDVVIPSEVVYNTKTLTVTEIGVYAFYGCRNLVSVVIPDSVTKIGEDTFSICLSLTSVIIPDSVIEIGYEAFSGCISLVSVVIPDSVTEIGESAFRDCSSLSSVIIGDSVTEIGESAFYSCGSLASIIIPDTVMLIGHEAFSGCSALKEIKLSESLTQLDYGTFENCIALQSITIPGSVGKLIQRNNTTRLIFGDCTNLKIMRFEYSEDILQGYYNSGSTILKSDIEFLISSYYNKALPLEKVFIDRELSNSLRLPYLKELTLGQHITRVQIIPSSIGGSLETIECYAVEPPICPEFENAQYLNVVVKVPNVSLEKYQQADGWKNFWNLEGFDASDTSVEDINSDETIYEMGRYDINGNIVNDDYKGVIIIRYSDGFTKKILNR